MREIKFRGKRVEDNEWIFGYYVVTHDSHRIIYEDYEGFYCEEEVIPESVGQYTGLKDKNGNGSYKVYEGDIITIEGKIRGNIYENEPRRTDIVIPPIGTKAWNTAYKKAVDRGFDYTE